jgi:hypothetical protein
MNLKFSAGDLTIHRIIEQETTFLPALDLLPGLTPERLAENRPWMKQSKAQVHSSHGIRGESPLPAPLPARAG